MKERYFNREIDRILQNDVEIPREVEMKMEKALRQIGAKEIQKKKAKKSLRFQVALALAGAMILGTVTVGATGFFLWDKDVAKRFEADEEKQQILEEKKVAVPVEAFATDQGVTVSLEQSLMTERDMYLYFKVEMPEEISPDMDIFFDELELSIDGKTTLDYGLSWSGGEPYDMKHEQSNVRYWEYFVQAKDVMDLQGKTMTAHFKNLAGQIKNENVQSIAEGDWDLSWELDYAPSRETFLVDKEVPEENITVKSIDISPISMKVTYDWKQTFHEEESVDAAGNKVMSEEEDLPSIYPSQYRLKDGTLVDIDKNGMGSMGRNRENEDLVWESWQSTKVNIVEDIQSVIFVGNESGASYEMELQR
ncbi:MAG: DUF4179 domain-containing protein [Lachnospiraceae bacterium]|jgi:hypothetical protein|nr:DUF4179 domain-containing protein [Lachnospiraceae bacterium]